MWLIYLINNEFNKRKKEEVVRKHEKDLPTGLKSGRDVNNNPSTLSLSCNLTCLDSVNHCKTLRCVCYYSSLHLRKMRLRKVKRFVQSHHVPVSSCAWDYTIVQDRKAFWDTSKVMSSQKTWDTVETLVIYIYILMTQIFEVHYLRTLQDRDCNWMKEKHQLLQPSRSVFPWPLVFKEKDKKPCSSL